jgi:hypothetical protein
MSFSKAFVRAAYKTAVGQPIAGIVLSADETALLNTHTPKILAQMLTQNEKRWLTSKAFTGLDYRHHNDDVIFLSKTAGQEVGMDADRAEYWYRSMEIADINNFRTKQELTGFSAYGGIATNRDYVQGYFTNNSPGNAIAEWHIPPAGKVYQEMLAQHINIKPEGNGGTYGLGPTGTQSSRNGAKTAMQVFEHFCGATLNVVDFRFENRLAGICR